MIFSGWLLFSRKRGIESIGPGRYSAMMAVMSSMLLGPRPVQTAVMPADSI